VSQLFHKVIDLIPVVQHTSWPRETKADVAWVKRSFVFTLYDLS
jgi:hypothetical protein